MTTRQSEESISRKPLRLWPGVAAVVLQWLAMFLLPVAVPDGAPFGILAGVLGGLIVALWWFFFSRAPWVERIGAIWLMVVALLAASIFVDRSVATGMMGMLLPIYAIPVLSLALVAAAVVGRRLSNGPRRATIVGAILIACGAFTLIRTNGITGDAESDFAWRWTKTAEERLLAQAGNEKEVVALSPSPASPASLASPASPAATPAEEPLPARAGNQPTAPAPPAAKTTEKRADWSGFRGPERDGIIRGVRIATDWSRSAPAELWRRPIGPGWSSFAVHGNFVYTQEQRGDDEMVSCYKLTDGAPVWRHLDAVRFWESNGGAGPRATPAFNNGRVYAFGATGILNALDARNGSVVWSRNAASDTHTKIPGWGFASSPLIVGDAVIVATAGVLAAYDLGTGNPRWFGPAGGWGYSSPHPSTIDGVMQILLLNGTGAISVAPADGTLLWKHEWPSEGIVQPYVIAGRDVLIGSGSGFGDATGIGMRRVAVAHGPGGWTVEERWTSNGLKPYFNDFVVHRGHAFGFDGSILACIDLKDGKRRWKGGRYGHGQLVLLADQDLLLVLSEEGELALVAAASDQFTELARVPAIEGKTWNHPVLVGDVLLVRNGQEMVAFRLSLAGR